jgi:hypothetical protein
MTTMAIKSPAALFATVVARIPTKEFSIKVSLIALALSLTSAPALAELAAATDTDLTARFASLALSDTDTLDANGALTVNFVASQVYANVRIVQKAGKTFHSIRIKERLCPDPIPVGLKCAVIGNVYYVSDSEYTAKQLYATGVVTGILAVPFKYHFRDHATTAGSTLGGYIGLSKTYPSAGQFSLILGGGLALVPITAATTNSTSTSTTTNSSGTLTGISIATGIIGKVGSTNTQFGVLFGYDFVDKNANYKYDGKPWLSFTVGYSFSN